VKLSASQLRIHLPLRGAGSRAPEFVIELLIAANVRLQLRIVVEPTANLTNPFAPDAELPWAPVGTVSTNTRWPSPRASGQAVAMRQVHSRASLAGARGHRQLAEKLVEPRGRRRTERGLSPDRPLIAPGTCLRGRSAGRLPVWDRSTPDLSPKEGMQLFPASGTSVMPGNSFAPAVAPSALGIDGQQ